MSDLDVLKEIPGYKAILKSVLKSQIHLLMEQLSEHTGEESIILTASVHDGSLSHLGSSTGKGFLEGRDEIKSQFLGYCLKTYHKKKTHEPQKPYQRTHPSPRYPTQLPTPPAKRPRPHPVSMTMAPHIDTYSQSSFSPAEVDDSNVGYGSESVVDSSNVSVKMEQSENQSSIPQLEQITEFSDSLTSGDNSVPESVHLSHTQTSVAENSDDKFEDNVETEKNDSIELSSAIKVEQVEDELEITGVEMAASNFDKWGQGQAGYGEMDTSFDQSAEQSSYNKNISETTLSDGNQKSTAILTSGKLAASSLTGSNKKNSILHQPTGSSTGPWPGSSASDMSFKISEKSCNRNPGYDIVALRHFIEANSPKKVPQGEYTCEFCGKVYSIRQHLSRHYSVHTGERIFFCSLCRKDFRLKHHLKEHLILVHKKTPQDVEPFIKRKK